MASTVAAMNGAGPILCTDIGKEVLDNCRQTIDLNLREGSSRSRSRHGRSAVVGGGGGGGGGKDSGGEAASDDGPAIPSSLPEVRVRWFDWNEPDGFVGSTCPPTVSPSTATTTAVQPPACYVLTAADRSLFTNDVEVLLAADVVYVDEWTTSFAHAAYQLLSHPFGSSGNAATPAATPPTPTPESAATVATPAASPPPTLPRRRTRRLYLTIEKRINFSLDDLAPAAPAYEHFVREMVQSPLFHAVRLPVDFPQRFPGYTRVSQLELWEFTAAC